jgi:hypothetical protein
VINTGKELSDITLQDPASLGMVFRNLANHSSKSSQCFVRTFVSAARVGVRAKLCIKIWIELAIDSVMKESISYTSFVDMSRFRIRNIKGFVLTMDICLLFQIMMQC